MEIRKTDIGIKYIGIGVRTKTKTRDICLKPKPWIMIGTNTGTNTGTNMGIKENDYCLIFLCPYA